MSNNKGLVFATKIEADSFIKGLELSLVKEKPFKIYNRDNIYLIISGIGKAYAAMAVFFMISEFGTDVVYNIGAAGSTTLNNRIGDVFIIDRVVEYDRPRLVKRGLRILRPDVMKGVKTASLATQDRPVIETAHRQEMSEHADLVDMEGAAVIQACMLLNAGCFLIKYVTDTPEHEAADIIDNIRNCEESVFRFVKTNILKI
jgi:adenosylhomocysteine nucleosidase